MSAPRHPGEGGDLGTRRHGGLHETPASAGATMGGNGAR
jgi:hypothetical protein